MQQSPSEVVKYLEKISDNNVILVNGKKVLNKLGPIAIGLGLMVVCGEASAAELNGDHEGAVKIVKDWAIDASGSLAGEFVGGVVTGLLAGAAVTAGILSAPVMGALVLAGALVGGIYGSDAAKDLYELTKDKDDNGKRDIYDRITSIIFGSTTFKITDSLLINLNGTQSQLSVNLSRTDMVELAKNDIAMRYALLNLNPFTINNTDYSPHNKNGELDLYSDANDKGMTDAYLMDRAAMMTWFLRYFHGELDQNDSAHTGPKPYTEDWDTDDVQGNWDFSDTGRELPGGQPFKLTIDGAGLGLSNHQIIFGNSKNETLEGEGQNDRFMSIINLHA